MPLTTLTVNGSDVAVDLTTSVHEETGLSIIDITATMGEHTVSHRVTVGGESDPLPDDYTLEMLQAHVDSVRSEVAAKCEGLARAKSLAAQLV